MSKQLIYHSNTFSEDAPDTEVVSGKHRRRQACSVKKKNRVDFNGIGNGEEKPIVNNIEGQAHTREILLNCALSVHSTKQSPLGSYLFPVSLAPEKFCNKSMGPCLRCCRDLNFASVSRLWGPATWTTFKVLYPSTCRHI